VEHLKKRYVAVGAVNTLIGLSAFPFLYWMLGSLRIHYVFVLMASQVFCVTAAFSMYKFFVFKTAGNYLREFMKFTSFYLVYFLSSVALLPLLVELFGMHPLLSQLLISVGIIISSFFWHSRITFAHLKNRVGDNH
jgi:putative flippase GtrA